MLIAFMCGILVVPAIDAQSRHNGASRPSTTNSRPGTGRPGNNDNRPGSGNNRPNHGWPGDNNRPDRPGNQGGNHQFRPGRPGGNGRPEQGRPPVGNHRPGENPSSPGRPHTRPGFGANRPMPSRPPHLTPPPRPHRPYMPQYHRPMPPRAWRPYAGCPVVRGILGLSFGTALNVSLNYLYSSGYNVIGYGNGNVFLTDVSALNYIWPDATLYYGPNGGLDYSQFYYSTPYYDMARYNSLYGNFVANYGAPVNLVNSGGRITATWFGAGNGYITLEFGPRVIAGGGSRFFTTLTFGN